MANIIGINEEAINSLIYTIDSYSNSIMTDFNYLDDCVEELNTCFQCDAKQTFLNQYSEMKSNYSIIQQNLEVYMHDLVSAKSNNAEIEKEALRLAMKAVDHMNEVGRNNNKNF